MQSAHTIFLKNIEKITEVTALHYFLKPKFLNIFQNFEAR